MLLETSQGAFLPTFTLLELCSEEMFLFLFYVWQLFTEFTIGKEIENEGKTTATTLAWFFTFDDLEIILVEKRVIFRETAFKITLRKVRPASASSKHLETHAFSSPWEIQAVEEGSLQSAAGSAGLASSVSSGRKSSSSPRSPRGWPPVAALGRPGTEAPGAPAGEGSPGRPPRAAAPPRAACPGRGLNFGPPSADTRGSMNAMTSPKGSAAQQEMLSASPLPAERKWGSPRPAAAAGRPRPSFSAAGPAPGAGPGGRTRAPARVHWPQRVGGLHGAEKPGGQGTVGLAGTTALAPPWLRGRPVRWPRSTGGSRSGAWWCPGALTSGGLSPFVIARIEYRLFLFTKPSQETLFNSPSNCHRFTLLWKQRYECLVQSTNIMPFIHFQTESLQENDLSIHDFSCCYLGNMINLV